MFDLYDGRVGVVVMVMRDVRMVMAVFMIAAVIVRMVRDVKVRRSEHLHVDGADELKRHGERQKPRYDSADAPCHCQATIPDEPNVWGQDPDPVP